MGDRANVAFISTIEGAEDKTGTIYLYTHWNGTALPQTVRDSLASKRGRARWNDETYLCRIILSDMMKTQDCPTHPIMEAETGYGVGLSMPDGQERVLTVNCKTQRVRIGRKSWSFADYSTLSSPSW
jgi:hypothetical protein